MGIERTNLESVKYRKRESIAMILYDIEEVYNLLISQLAHWGWQYNKENIRKELCSTLERVEECLRALTYQHEKLNSYHTVTWSVFLYYLSNSLGKDKFHREAEVVYYLNKIMHCNDWFYQIQLPRHFFGEHPIGSVLGRANYGDYLYVYQGTTVGGNEKDGLTYYPTLGDNVLMYANSTVLGDTKIGNNVIISAGTYLINENIPDNSIVFGRSPNIEVKEKDEDHIKEMTKTIWKW